MGRATRGEWAARVARWERSGLTRAQFAARERIKPRTLSFWKWKLRAAGTASPAAQAVRFVELVGTTPGVPALELAPPAGYRIGVAPGFDVATLRTLLTVLESPR